MKNTFVNNTSRILVLLTGMAITACTDDFAELNTNPKSLPDVEPQQMLYTAITNYAQSGHYWINWACKTRWMQYGVSIWGYGPTGYTYFVNDIGGRLYDEYQNMGALVTNMEYLSSLRAYPDAYKHMNAAARIILIAKAIQVSDLYGSLVYSNGWKARKGMADEASLLPAFQTQEELSSVWDNELKACIAALQTSADGQVSIAGYDRAYNGNAGKWVKAGNAIRLRLASRLLKRSPDFAKQIAEEVLASNNAANVMSGTDDSFIFWFDVLYTNLHPGDWHSSRDMLVASRALINYMNCNDDPRRRIYFRMNNLTDENVAAWNAAQTDNENQIPQTWTRYEGASASRSDWNTAADRVYTARSIGEGSAAIDMRAANYPQARLWKGDDVDGNGGNWAPVMTYSDFCFLAAEFVLDQQVQSSITAQQWYENGVKASLRQWSDIGRYCDLYDYSALTEDELTDFMQKTDIAWNQTKGLEQIRAQAWVDNFKNVDEAWAQWKRTGYPNATATNIVKFDVCYPVAGGDVGVIPRRVKYSYPDEGVHNYANLKKRLDDMAADAQFGEISSEWGRLWWDKE
jgi:hypothetical protein